MTEVDLRQVVCALQHYEQRLHDLPPARIVPEGLLATLPARPVWRWLRDLIQPIPFAADVFLNPAARLCVAPPPLLQQALLLRALYARRTALRRCIDRTVLQPLRQTLGDDVLARLLHQAARRSPTSLGLPDIVDMPDLMHEGLQRLLVDGSIATPGLVRLALVQLPPHAGVLSVPHADPAETIAFLHDLPSLLPELP